MTRFRRMAAFVLVVLVVGSCAAQPPPPGVTPTFKGATSGPGALPPEPPPELMVIPPPINENARLLMKLSARANVCWVLDTLLGQPEPDLRDTDELTTMALNFYSSAITADPNSRVQNPEDRDARIRVPSEVMARIEVAKQAMYAFQVRVGYAASLRDAGQIDEATAERWLKFYWLSLVNSGYSEAMEQLLEDDFKYCSS